MMPFPAELGRTNKSQRSQVMALQHQIRCQYRAQSIILISMNKYRNGQLRQVFRYRMAPWLQVLSALGVLLGGGAFCLSLWADSNASRNEKVSVTEFTEEELSHWAFQPILRPALPSVEHSDQIRSPIDVFLLSRLESKALVFSQPAAKRELLRRAKFDLVGLPPTSDEIAQFGKDGSPNALEQLIDRFLASPQYGETWGRYWLDLVRFAETAGFNADPDRPLAYKYRDYVIRSFNNDTPSDRFIQ